MQASARLSYVLRIRLTSDIATNHLQRTASPCDPPGSLGAQQYTLTQGQQVSAGDIVVVLEAMKMEQAVASGAPICQIEG